MTLPSLIQFAAFTSSALAATTVFLIALRPTRAVEAATGVSSLFTMLGTAALIGLILTKLVVGA